MNPLQCAFKWLFMEVTLFGNAWSFGRLLMHNKSNIAFCLFWIYMKTACRLHTSKPIFASCSRAILIFKGSLCKLLECDWISWFWVMGSKKLCSILTAEYLSTVHISDLEESVPFCAVKIEYLITCKLRYAKVSFPDITMYELANSVTNIIFMILTKYKLNGFSRWCMSYVM